MAIPNDVLNSLKEIAKQKGIRYPELARRIKVSLPTVKRWMNSELLALGDLFRICEALEVNLQDVLSHAEKAPPKSHRFSEEQERFFAKNPSYLAYLYEIRDGLKPSEIERKHNIKRVSTRAYLRKLQQMRLIAHDGGDQVRCLIRGHIEWSDHGLLGLTSSRGMIERFSRRILSKLGQESELYLSLWTRFLSKEEYQQLQSDFQALHEKYRRLSQSNQKIYSRGQLEKVFCMVAVDIWDDQEFSRISECNGASD